MNPFVYPAKKLTVYRVMANQARAIATLTALSEHGEAVIVWTAWRWSIKELGMRKVW